MLLPFVVISDTYVLYILLPWLSSVAVVTAEGCEGSVAVISTLFTFAIVTGCPY
jgi:hypothetical protein